MGVRSRPPRIATTGINSCLAKMQTVLESIGLATGLASVQPKRRPIDVKMESAKLAVMVTTM